MPVQLRILTIEWHPYTRSIPKALAFHSDAFSVTFLYVVSSRPSLSACPTPARHNQQRVLARLLTHTHAAQSKDGPSSSCTGGGGHQHERHIIHTANRPAVKK
jgi:hypothetical protein